MRLSTKLLLYNVLAKGIILLIFLMGGPIFLHYFALKNIDTELLEKREYILTLISNNGIEGFFYEEDSLAGFGSYNILKEEYILLEKLDVAYPLDSIFNEERILDEVAVPYRVCAYVFGFENDYFLLEIGKSLETIQDLNAIIFRLMVILLILFIFFSFILDHSFNKHIFHPFKLIIQDKIAKINEPLAFDHSPIKSSTEDFRILDEAISQMIWRIQKAFNQERVFISHASHELKTPISILQSKIEALFSKGKLNHSEMEKLMDMQRTIQRMKKTLNSLLLLSKVNNAQYIKEEEFSLNQLIVEVVEEWEPIAEDKGIKLTTSRPLDFNLKNSNRSLCHILIRNLLSNAIKYSPSNSEVKINGSSISNGFLIEIIDEGPGISEERINQIQNGQVFLKDAHTDSSGYGLQIVFKIASFLGIDIHILNTSTGTNFQLTFK